MTKDEKKCVQCGVPVFEKNWGNGGRMLHEVSEPHRAHPPGSERCISRCLVLRDDALGKADAIVAWIHDHHVNDGLRVISAMLDDYQAARAKVKP